jgi:prepilin-type N-terminal cleavage/methylation domain-containing protein
MKTKGFTLIELMIVFAIVAILVAITIPIIHPVHNHGRGMIIECHSAVDNSVIRSPVASYWHQEQQQQGYYSSDNIHEDFYPRPGDVCKPIDGGIQ